MIRPISTRNMVTQLGVAFTVLALLMALLLSFLIRGTVLWAEDSVAMRHLKANKDYAIAQYLTGADGPIQMDSVTIAYNDRKDLPSFVPLEYRAAEQLLSEIELEETEFFFLADQYSQDGQWRTIYLVSASEGIEISEEDGYLLNLLILFVTSLLLLVLGFILLQLSRHLFKPINMLNEQLVSHRGNIDIPFELPERAASEFQEMAKQLNHYRSELARLLKREQAFARYTSHELRTPLTVIKGANSLFNPDSAPQFQQKQQQRIRSAANQMEETVEALLSLVRNERHRTLEPWRTLTEAELQQLIEVNKPPALGNPINVTLDVQGEPQIRAGKPLWAMVFGNLLRNAIGASIEGNIKVTLTAEQLTVDDDGNGLGEKSKDGHGLGLMIVTDICERYEWNFDLFDLEQGGCRAQLIFNQPAADQH